MTRGVGKVSCAAGQAKEGPSLAGRAKVGVEDMMSIDALRPCELFAGLNDQELSQIAAIACEENFSAGDLICAERELANRLFILHKGRVRLHIMLHSALEPNGEATIEEVEPGRIFGWSSLVKQRRFTASARALEPATVIVIDAHDLDRLFDRDAHVGFVVMKQLAEVIACRLRHTREIGQKEGFEV
jgi:CRP/FNR family cyclic AMP-dependent transcriptional regulator